MTTYPHPSPMHPGAESMPVSATAVLGTLAVAGASVLAAGMAEWGPGDWAAFVPVVLLMVGGWYSLRRKDRKAESARLLKLERDQIKLRTEVRQDVQEGVVAAAGVAATAADHAAKRLEAAAAAMVPPQQMDELAERIAGKLRSPAPDGMTPDGRPKVGT